MLNRITDAGIGSSGSDRLAVLSVLPFVSRRIGRRGIARSRAIQRSRTDERVLAAPLVQQAVATVPSAEKASAPRLNRITV